MSIMFDENARWSLLFEGPRYFYLTKLFTDIVRLPSIALSAYFYLTKLVNSFLGNSLRVYELLLKTCQIIVRSNLHNLHNCIVFLLSSVHKPGVDIKICTTFSKHAQVNIFVKQLLVTIPNIGYAKLWVGTKFQLLEYP